MTFHFAIRGKNIAASPHKGSLDYSTKRSTRSELAWSETGRGLRQRKVIDPAVQRGKCWNEISCASEAIERHCTVIPSLNRKKRITYARLADAKRDVSALIHTSPKVSAQIGHIIHTDRTFAS